MNNINQNTWVAAYLNKTGGRISNSNDVRAALQAFNRSEAANEPDPFRIWSNFLDQYVGFTFKDICHDPGANSSRFIVFDPGWEYEQIHIDESNIEYFTGKYNGSGEPIYVNFVDRFNRSSC